MRQFREAYAAQRAAEGRGTGGTTELVTLPYLRTGPWARHWAVRARTFDAFVRRVLAPLERSAAARTLRVLDLGAGNGWLCARLIGRGHMAVAMDVRTDTVDGLGAGAGYADHLKRMFGRVAASFEAVPVGGARFDIVVFNASLHYATDVGRVLREAVRLLAPQGRVVIMDSPFYRSDGAGQAMVTEKRRHAAEQFGDRASALLAGNAIEYLTPRGLKEASAPLGLNWTRHRVWYPAWYELRPLIARIRGRRAPSRFDVWEGRQA